ncbi:MAG: protein translocase subunit SecD [Candidatus Liptonbacteria bacterium]|nr:protein translocase subunit SecD [Candidatus Liptonbacteria bacterium]
MGIATIAGALFVSSVSVGGVSFSSWRPWKLGLDLVGGSHLTYDIDLSGIASGDRSSVTEGLRDIVEQRVNLFGVSEPNVVIAREGDLSGQDAYRLIVELAGVKDAAEAIRQIGKTAFLDFREVRANGTTDEFIPTLLTGRYLKKAEVAFGNTAPEPQIALQFNDEGAKLFEDLTTRNVGKQLCAFIDDAPISCPRVNEAIPGGNAVITGQFTLEEARQIVNLFNAGALPAPVSLIGQETIGASLGTHSLRNAIVAGAWGTAIIAIFMMLYYRAAGLGIYAAVALLIYVVLTLSLFKLVPVTMSLAGIAGFLLSVGMAVDANVLIFERVKEERRRGLPLATALEEGFRRAWSSIRDSNITTMLSAIILYYFTTSFVRGFALTLLIGVIVSMFTAITVTRSLLRVFVASKS